MSDLESFKRRYDTDTTKVVIGGRTFRFFVPRSLDSFVDHRDIFHDFPLWVKIWEASVILADYLAGLDSDSEKGFLEIGCGIGLVGIVASAFGHNVTMTEYNQDALTFARANALLNNSSNLEIVELDWTNPRLLWTFDYIVGSEIIYRETDFQSIFNLFKAYLRQGGEIILAGGMRKTGMEFMSQMSGSFTITARKKILRSQDKEITIMLSSMKFK